MEMPGLQENFAIMYVCKYVDECMPQIILNIKDDLQGVWVLPMFCGTHKYIWLASLSSKNVNTAEPNNSKFKMLK